MTKHYDSINLTDLTKVGVYAIYHESRPERFYIGSTTKYKSDRPSHTGFYKRFYDHFRELKLGKHSSKFLQNTINKHGIQGLRFKIIEICNDHSISEIREKEQHYINIMNSVYNVFTTVYPKGRTWTDEERKKQSEKLQGKALPQFVYLKKEKQIHQYTKDERFIITFPSIGKAEILTGIDRGSISNCAAGKRKSAGGYKWKFIKT